MSAFETGKYRNLFAEIGKSQEEIQKKLDDCFNTFFYGSEEERIYHTAGDDMGYLEDTGNHDARTEGMSYGMMMCVQMDMKEEFDRIWKWSKTYMFMTEGENVVETIPAAYVCRPLSSLSRNLGPRGWSQRSFRPLS